MSTKVSNSGIAKFNFTDVHQFCVIMPTFHKTNIVAIFVYGYNNQSELDPVNPSTLCFNMVNFTSTTLLPYIEFRRLPRIVANTNGDR